MKGDSKSRKARAMVVERKYDVPLSNNPFNTFKGGKRGKPKR